MKHSNGIEIKTPDEAAPYSIHAFPSEFVTSNNNAGLTKLEYMATHIAVGIMASIGENEHTTPEHTAGISVKYAKALIAELNKEQQ
jgi:hypothetical protein